MYRIFNIYDTFYCFLAKIRVLTRKSCQFWQEKASQSERGI